MILASILLIVGIFFLLKAMGIITEDIWGFIWPSVLIVIALTIIFKSRRRNPFWWDVKNWHEFGQKMQGKSDRD